MTRGRTGGGLRLSEDLSLPLDAVTETFAFLGRRGSGKTTAASVLAEEAIGAGVPVVVIDPTGAWWGLRSSADGRGDGLPVVIFGGEHADVGLDERAGEVIADAVVEGRFPAIIDLSMMSKSAMRRFMADFAERLYRRNREPLHVIIDEADVLVPQRLTSEGLRVFGAIDDIVRRGRIRGLGVSLISQRPAVISKDVLSQVEVLVALQLTSKIDVGAIDEWVRLNATDEEAGVVKDSLASLPVGTGWVWSPALLGILEKVQIRRRWTFDSSATPKPGQARVVAQAFAPVDTALLGERIEALTEQVARSDPKALRARVAELERDLAASGPVPAPQVVEKIVEVPVLDDEDRDLVQRLLDELGSRVDRWGEALAFLGGRLRMAAPAGSADSAESSAGSVRTPPPSSDQAVARGSDAKPSPASSTADGRLGKTERTVLSVLVQHGAMRNDRLALLSGYSARASTIGVALGRLRRAGLVEQGQPNRATSAGVELLGDDLEALPSGQALLDYWRNRFGRTERRVLDAVLRAYPEATSQAQIAQATGYSPTASTIGVALSRLRKVGVVDGWRISDTFARSVGLIDSGGHREESPLSGNE